MKFCWILNVILTAILMIANHSENLELLKPLSIIILIMAIFVITPQIVWHFYKEEEFSVLFAGLFANILIVFIAVSGLLHTLYYGDITMLAVRWTFCYFIMTGLSYFAVRQLDL